MAACPKRTLKTFSTTLHRFGNEHCNGCGIILTCESIVGFIMISTTRCLLIWGMLVGTCTAAAAQQPPSFANQVRRFLAKYCLECHSADKSKGGLNLESFKSLMQGSDNGPVVVPGKPGESRLVLLVEGKDKQKM